MVFEPHPELGQDVVPQSVAELQDLGDCGHRGLVRPDTRGAPATADACPLVPPGVGCGPRPARGPRGRCHLKTHMAWSQGLWAADPGKVGFPARQREAQHPKCLVNWEGVRVRRALTAQPRGPHSRTRGPKATLTGSPPPWTSREGSMLSPRRLPRGAVPICRLSGRGPCSRPRAPPSSRPRDETARPRTHEVPSSPQQEPEMGQSPRSPGPQRRGSAGRGCPPGQEENRGHRTGRPVGSRQAGSVLGGRGGAQKAAGPTRGEAVSAQRGTSRPRKGGSVTWYLLRHDGPAVIRAGHGGADTGDLCARGPRRDQGHRDRRCNSRRCGWQRVECLIGQRVSLGGWKVLETMVGMGP